MAKKNGRPALLDDDATRTKFINAVRGGNYKEHAFAFAGVGRTAGFNYLAKAGELREVYDTEVVKDAGFKLAKADQRYVDLLNAIEKARADAIAERLIDIKKSGQGEHVIETTTRTIVRNKGTEDEYHEIITVEKRAKPEWQAHAWWLERTENQKFGRRDKVEAKVDHSGKVEVDLAKQIDERAKRYEEETLAKVIKLEGKAPSKSKD
jgi:hypothetical protein